MNEIDVHQLRTQSEVDCRKYLKKTRMAIFKHTAGNGENRPIRCFRYMKLEYAEQALRDRLFKVSRPSQFNDPFECRVRLINTGEVPSLRKYVHDNYERLRFECIRRAKSPTAAEQAAFTEEFIFKKYLDAAKKHDTASSLTSFEDIVLFMCFVKEKGLTPDSDTLFWSHYADSGRGVRMTFNLLPRPKGGIYYMKDVIYKDRIPSFDLSSLGTWMQGDSFKKYLDDILFTKGVAWRYENEIRMVVPRKLPPPINGSPHIYEKTINGVKMDFVHIDYSVIKRLDFGPKVDVKRSEDIAKELSSLAQTNHIQCFRAEFHPERYTYTYKRI